MRSRPSLLSAALVTFALTGCLRASEPTSIRQTLARDSCYRDVVEVLGVGGTSVSAYLPCAIDRPARLVAGADRVRYPEMLKSGMIGGSGRIQFVVDTTGRPVAGSMLPAEASHQLFQVALRNVLPLLRFEPARRGGRKVPMLTQLEAAWVVGYPKLDCPAPQRVLYHSEPQAPSLVSTFITYEGCMIDFAPLMKRTP
jgi:hypothetical protein